jgi:hypothetical protein
VCDIDGKRGVTASDARVALLVALGLRAAPTCAIERQIVFSVAGEHEYNSLQIEASYEAGGGSFYGEAAARACETFIDTVIGVYADDPERKVLSLGFFGFGIGPIVDLARCPYRPEPGAGLSIELRVTHASDYANQELPTPTVSYRVE